MNDEMNSTWVDTSLIMGGKISFHCDYCPDAMFCAIMEFANGEKISSALSISTIDALNHLNTKLADDAAKEMRDAGAV